MMSSELSVINRGVFLSMSQSVGVVVPCKDEIATVRLCLESLRAQTPNVSIVVMDNGWTDGSREIAEQLADQVIDLPGVPISTEHNAGAALLADVDVLAFVDADFKLAADWLSAGLAGLETVDMVGSRTWDPSGSWVASRWPAIEQQRSHEQSLLWSQHLLVKRETFQALGGFDETMRTGEDSDVSARLRTNGGRLSIRNDMVVTHPGFPALVSRFVRRELWHTRHQRLVWANGPQEPRPGCAHRSLAWGGRSSDRDAAGPQGGRAAVDSVGAHRPGRVGCRMAPWRFPAAQLAGRRPDEHLERCPGRPPGP